MLMQTYREQVFYQLQVTLLGSFLRNLYIHLAFLKLPHLLLLLSRELYVIPAKKILQFSEIF
jgi:hypothetical protein